MGRWRSGPLERVCVVRHRPVGARDLGPRDTAQPRLWIRHLRDGRIRRRSHRAHGRQGNLRPTHHRARRRGTSGPPPLGPSRRRRPASPAPPRGGRQLPQRPPRTRRTRSRRRSRAAPRRACGSVARALVRKIGPREAAPWGREAAPWGREAAPWGREALIRCAAEQPMGARSRRATRRGRPSPRRQQTTPSPGRARRRSLVELP